MTQSKVLIGQALLVISIIILSLWGATQWTADQFGFQNRLGSPWFTVADTKFYYPWRIFQWWYAYEPYAPHIFRKAGFLAGGGGLAGEVTAILMSVWRARLQKNVTTYGSARWGTRKDLDAAGLLKSEGVFLGRWKEHYLRHKGAAQW